jgi:hypothetical protein
MHALLNTLRVVLVIVGLQSEQHYHFGLQIDLCLDAMEKRQLPK